MVILEADGFSWSLSRARCNEPAECCAPHCYYISRLFSDRFLDRRAAFCVELIYLEESLGEESPRIEATPRNAVDTLPACYSDRWLRGPQNVNKKSRVEAINKRRKRRLCCVVLLSLSTWLLKDTSSGLCVCAVVMIARIKKNSKFLFCLCWEASDRMWRVVPSRKG